MEITYFLKKQTKDHLINSFNECFSLSIIYTYYFEEQHTYRQMYKL